MSLSAGRGPAGAWGEQGTLSGLSSQALLEGKGSGGQPGQHSQSISSKQGKLIPGPRMLLLELTQLCSWSQTLLFRASGAGHSGSGISTGRQAVTGGQAEFSAAAHEEGGEHPDWEGARPWGARAAVLLWWGYAEHGDSTTTPAQRKSPAQQAALAGGLHWASSSWATHREGVKKEMQTSSFTGSIPLL